MKKILYLMAALAIFAVSCTKPEPVKPSITLSTPADVTVPTDGGIQTVSFTSNVPWTASIDNSNWSVSPTSGEAGTATVKVTAPNNTSEDAIVVKVTLKAETTSQVVTFTQLQKDAMVVDVTSYDAPAEGGKVSVKVKANVEVTATTDASWLKIATATKAAVEKTFDVEVSANEGEAREGTIILSGAGKKAEVTIKQAALEPYFNIVEGGPDESGYYWAGAEGAEFVAKIETNIDYEVDDKASSYSWQHVTVDKANNTIRIVIDPATLYSARESYFKITIPKILTEDGEATVLRIYTYQDGLPAIKYSLSMYDMEFDTWGTTVLSNAVYNGKHYVSNGQDLYEIDPAAGSSKKIDWAWGNGMTQKVISNDDAGNLIVCNHTEYTEEYLDGYFIMNVVTPAGEESNLITKPAWECGGTVGAKISVRGDATATAFIVAPVEGTAGNMSNIIAWWEISEGSVSNFDKTVVTGLPLLWGEPYWNSYPNNYPSAFATGMNHNGGVILSGYYDINVMQMVAPDGSATAAFGPNEDISGNYAYQSVDCRAIDGSDVYVVEVASTFFPEWGLPPLVMLLSSDSMQAVGKTVHEAAVVDYSASTYFNPDWDYGISPKNDVKIYNPGNGKVGVFMADLNARSIEAFEFDPVNF